MRTAAEVTKLIAELKAQGISKSEMVIRIAEACLGWPYVWGGAGQLCTPANRKKYADRSACPDGESQQIIKKCQVLSGKKSTCDGCPYYPNGQAVRFFDCQGFDRWILAQVGVTLEGGGATSQWNTNKNWVQKGDIIDIPKKIVSCVYWKSKTDAKKMAHTGLYLTDNNIIHCSGEVKRDTLATKGWTNYGVPNGLDGDVPVTYPTLKKGSKGEYVTLAQTKLIQRGYDLAPYGADGSYGNKTVAAVKAFQKDNGLTADGVIGQKTWDVLLSGEITTYTVTIQHVSKTVAEAIVKTYGGTMTIEEGGVK